jgi:hypothetical protein
MRIVGTIQLAGSGLALVLLLITSGCGVLLGGPKGAPAAFVAALIPLAMVLGFLYLSLRIQQAGEQLENLAEEGDADFLELAFVRLKTVYSLELGIGLLYALMLVLGAL